MLTDDQRAHYEMFNRVLTFFELHKDILDKIPELREHFETFKENLKQINELILSSDEKTIDEVQYVKNMEALMELTEKFGKELKN